MTKPTIPGPAGDPHLGVVDLFHTAWVKAFIRVNNAVDLETVEILLSIGQQLMGQVPRRAGHARLDVVLAAMLRPTLIAARAADVNLRHGLYEPALAQVRTVLELDLALEYMLANPATKDGVADRYLAWSRKKRIGPLQEQLTNPVLRAQLDGGRAAWIEERLHIYREELAALPAANAENQTEHNWHPHQNVRGLAQHLSRLDDYLQLYAPMSNMNVHAADPESHLDIAADGTVTIRVLATTEPWKVATALKLLASMLLRFLPRLLDEWGLQSTPLARLLTAAQMRFVGEGDGTIPEELRPETWATAIRVTQAPLGEILEEGMQLILVVVSHAPDGLTEAELRNNVGVDVPELGDQGHALLRSLLDRLVEMGALRLDAAGVPPRYRTPTNEPQVDAQ